MGSSLSNNFSPLTVLKTHCMVASAGPSCPRTPGDCAHLLSRPPAAGQLRELCHRELLGELWGEHVSLLLPLRPREGTVGSRSQTTATTESYTRCLGRAGETRAERICVSLARGSGSGEQGTAPWAASSDLLLTLGCGDLLSPSHSHGALVSWKAALCLRGAPRPQCECRARPGGPG